MPSTSFIGWTAACSARTVSCSGTGRRRINPVTRGSAFVAGIAASISAWVTSAGKIRYLEGDAQCLSGALLIADVDHGRGRIADQHQNQARRPSCFMKGLGLGLDLGADFLADLAAVQNLEAAGHRACPVGVAVGWWSGETVSSYLRASEATSG